MDILIPRKIEETEYKNKIQSKRHLIKIFVFKMKIEILQSYLSVPVQ